MIELKVGRLLELHELLTIEKGFFERCQQKLQKEPDGPDGFPPRLTYLVAHAQRLLGWVREVEAISGEAGLTSTNQAAGRTRDMLITSIRTLSSGSALQLWASSCGTIFQHLSEIVSRTRDDCSARLYFQVSADHAPLLRNDLHAEPPFGRMVALQFPSLMYEIDEAAKCLALERSTASAFHSIRALEAAIRALSRSLGIPDPTKAHERSWMKLLNALKAEIDARWPTNSDRLSGDGEFFENAYAALAAMQNPWRNATMHLDQIYTLEGATHVRDVVKGFMSRVAARMDEDGSPKA